MSILDGLLGGVTDGGSSATFVGNTTEVSAQPALGLDASDISLHNESVLGTTDLGIGDVGLGLAAPVHVQADTQIAHESDGGLLSGLL
jgi:hypothetical protein